eukprot:490496_1
MANIHIIFILLISISLTCSNYTQCGYKDQYGSIWDLSSLYLSPASSDNFYTFPNGANPQYNETFFINFCGNINAIPPRGNCGKSQSQICIKPNTENTQCETFGIRSLNTLTYGYVAYPDGTCYAIGGGESESFVNKTKLIEYTSIYNDNNNPQQLIIKYNYGDLCNKNGSILNRALIIHMLCNTAITEIEQGTKVINANSDICNNILSIESPFGCPIINGTYIQPFESTQINKTYNITDIETTILIDTDEYSIIGECYKYDFDGMIIFGIQVKVNIDCTNIEFILISPANNTWFAVGFGGDYSSGHDHNVDVSSGEDESHTDMDNQQEGVNSRDIKQNMNGYSLVVLSINDVYESILEVGMIPKRQSDLGGINDLNCNGEEMDGVRRIICKRVYETNDLKFDDFYEFFVGVNPMIYAYGTIGNDGMPIKHGINGYGEAKVHFIYMEQKGKLCGFAEIYDKENDDIDEGINEKEMWMIIAVVFVILFAIFCGIVIFLIWKLKQKNNQEAGRTQTSSSGYAQAGGDDDD